MEDDNDMFSEDIDIDLIHENYYCGNDDSDYGILFKRIMQKMNRINQKIDMQSEDSDVPSIIFTPLNKKQMRRIFETPT